jgi:ubiquinone/menaquinone biosynthesis C-methylase UbiE
VPGADAPALSPSGLALAADLLIRPSAYPLTPMYMLDKYYRIIDWNLAFTLAFDGTMEGRIGHSVLEWTYWLDNYKEVFDHGSGVFSDETALPVIDKENIEFTSRRYGKIRAVKRAYQIPDDDGMCLAWLATLEMTFEGSSEEKYQNELVRVLGLDQLWTEYATSYDRVLLNTKVYPDLLCLLLGGGRSGAPAKIAAEATVLDLGAGTGNISKLLIEDSPRRTVFAVEQNRAMLEILKAKCGRYTSEDKTGPGVIIVRQDVTSLFGFDDQCCDYVVVNNVLYSVDNYIACLTEAFRVLKPGGEIRISEPRQDTSLEVLFERINRDLQESGKYQEFETDYLRVREINQFRLRPLLNRWTIDSMQDKLKDAGFAKITYASSEPYAGQSMLICAQK